MEIKLSQNEINILSEEVYKIIKDIPIYYLNEIVENAVLERKKEGEIEYVDYVYSSEDDSDCSLTDGSSDEDSSIDSESESD